MVQSPGFAQVPEFVQEPVFVLNKLPENCLKPPLMEANPPFKVPSWFSSNFSIRAFLDLFMFLKFIVIKII